MFGCIVAGRLVQTNLQQVQESKFIFELPEASNINHIVVFLLGTVPFQPGYAATVHFLWPNKEWQLLGKIANDKPSAIFRLRGNVIPQQSDGMSVDGAGVVATLGISVEPEETVQQQLAAIPSTASNTVSGVSTTSTANFPVTSTALTRPGADSIDASKIAEMILRHLLNYIYSFSTTPGQPLPFGAQIIQPGGGPASISENSYLPLRAFQGWYDNVLSKLKQGNAGIAALLDKDG